jgi:hypothetical protein
LHLSTRSGRPPEHDYQTLPEISAASSEDVEAALVKNHHAGGRKPASLSDEAREIEGHFNVR